MTELSARFKLIDEISGKLARIAEAGQQTTTTWENAGKTVNDAFAGISSAISSAVTAIGQASEANAALAETINDACVAMEELAENDKVSEQTKEELVDAIENASLAFEELEAAQDAAQKAMDEYNAIAGNGTATIEELEAAGQNAANAADKLTAANTKATEATEELSKATETAAKEAGDAADVGSDAVETIIAAFSAAGITAIINQIIGQVQALADAFSAASKTVVQATGATGEALEGLTDSMTRAFAANDESLSDTAAALGEINTRLGYTGEALEETTQMFMDFADATHTNAVGAVRNVTQLMNQWDVEAGEMESMLSRLIYAGQTSGISINALSSQLTNNKAILDQLGFSLNEATALFMNMERTGTQTGAVMMGFRTALSKGAISSLEDLYEILRQAEEGLLSAEAAAEIFGSRAGVTIVNAARTGVFNLEKFVGALENASGTLAATDDAAKTTEEKWAQASNSISAAFTTAIAPAFNKLSAGLASVINAFGEFLNKHPLIVKSLAAFGAALGAVAIAFAVVSAKAAVYNAAVAISTAFTAAFGVTLSAAIWPITLAVAGITALVAIVSALSDAFSDADDETAGMTAATKKQYYELQNLNSEYKRAVDTYGDNSEAALRLKYQVDDLTKSFAENRQTVEEFQAEVDNFCKSTDKLAEAYAKANKEIDEHKTGGLALIQKYSDLAAQSNLTKEQLIELDAVTEALEKKYPDLAKQIDRASMSSEDYADTLRKACEAETEAQRYQKTKDSYNAALEKQAALEKEIAKAEENLRLARENESDSAGPAGAWLYSMPGVIDNCTAEIREYQEALDKLQAAQTKNNTVLEECKRYFSDIATAERAAANEAEAYQKAAERAYKRVQKGVEELSAAYDKAYEAALKSFQGQFNLFTQADMQSKEYLNSTVAAAQEALNSQLAYWETYNANLKALNDYGAQLTGDAKAQYDELLKYASSGSEKAAGFAASMANAIAAGDNSAIEQLSSTIKSLRQQQEAAAKVTADWQTSFTQQMQGYADDMARIIMKDLDLSDEAAESAKATLDSYINQILAQKVPAIQAAQSVAQGVSDALAGASINIAEQANPTIGISAPAHAAGTLNGENYYIAGENGPELIVGAAGSEVFPASETDRLIAALNTLDANNAQNNITQYETTSTYGDTAINNYSSAMQYETTSTYGDTAINNYSSAMQYETANTYEDTAINNYSSTVQVRETTAGLRENAQEPQESTRRVRLEIAGSGAIELGGQRGVSKEKVLEILYDYLKPVLMDILKQDIYEEGDYSHGY